MKKGVGASSLLLLFMTVLTQILARRAEQASNHIFARPRRWAVAAWVPRGAGGHGDAVPQRVRHSTLNMVRTKKAGGSSGGRSKSSRRPNQMAEQREIHSFEDLTKEITKGVYGKNGSHFKDLNSCPTLVLNADYQPLSYLPLSLWSWQEAVKAVFMDRVVVLATYSRSVRSANIELSLPSVIALKQYINQHKQVATFTRRHLYLRDGHRCAYCGRIFDARSLSYDHVIPRKLGGKTSWKNVVTSCQKCNNIKGSSHPKDLGKLGMRLHYQPHVPSFNELQVLARKYPPHLMHETWEEFLYFEKPLNQDEFNQEMELPPSEATSTILGG